MRENREQRNLLAQIEQVLASTSEQRSALRQVIKLLHNRFDHFDWTGIYLLDENVLKLTEYCGAPSPHSEIPLGNGICGAAAVSKTVQNVPDVDTDARYLACSLATKSEIVVPILSGGQVWGEIDIDSHQLAAFDRADEKFLQQVAEHLADYFQNNSAKNRIEEA